MKLKTKLTALCGGLLLAVALCLSGTMLWQVREQAYGSLLESASKTFEEMTQSFQNAVYHSGLEDAASLPEKTYLTYCFRTTGEPGGALIVNGERLSVPTTIDPSDYLEVAYNSDPMSARCFVGGRHYLILGSAQELWGMRCELYLVSDASYIYTNLQVLAGRFALLALIIGLVGLAAVRCLLGRALSPLAALSEAAERIAAGNYSRRVPVNSQDEVGALAEDFNRMALAVETHVDALREQNQRQQLFLGAVTHELKTPLTSLLLNVNTLQNVYLPPQKQEAILERMDTQLHWLETMVRKLLLLLSMEKNAKLEPASVPALMGQVQALTREICKKYGVTLEIRFTADTLSMDRDLMCSALVNLVENSAKASQPGEKIQLLAYAGGFTVTDRGCGIAPEDLQRVTEPFYMGDPSRSKKNGGFGLGLALVREIAAVHGGSLVLESTPGQGTTARIVLPES